MVCSVCRRIGQYLMRSVLSGKESPSPFMHDFAQFGGVKPKFSIGKSLSRLATSNITKGSRIFSNWQN
jgi:hypothetical protein